VACQFLGTVGSESRAACQDSAFTLTGLTRFLIVSYSLGFARRRILKRDYDSAHVSLSLPGPAPWREATKGLDDGSFVGVESVLQMIKRRNSSEVDEGFELTVSLGKIDSQT
jgi:hypothetical protein